MYTWENSGKTPKWLVIVQILKDKIGRRIYGNEGIESAGKGETYTKK